MEKIDIMRKNIEDTSFDILKILLKDKTTGKYILWATNNYIQYGYQYMPNNEIKPELMFKLFNDRYVQPRVSKSQLEQSKRTRDNAEVFTPSWVCNIQNNLIDESWFGRKNVFNISEGNSWTTIEGHIEFPEDRKWTEYIDARRLEISCGEAPYLVSRYDTVTGDMIPLYRRIGLLDRKIRIVNENTETEEEWYKWVVRAFQSIYGYEYQGDNVLLARENLLRTFIEYYEDRFKENPSKKQIKKIANIISWNIWQMDGITCTVPSNDSLPVYEQLTLFDGALLENKLNNDMIFSRIYDWRANKSLEFKSMRNGG